MDDDQCGWKVDGATGSGSKGGVPSAPRAVTTSTSGRPTLPAATARRPAACRTDSSIVTVVVLPLVPVTAYQGAGSAPALRRQASSGSPTTSMPFPAAARSSG